MKLEDYRLADCKRFRTPAVDMRLAEDAVARALMEAWQRGYRVEDAIHNVVNDSSIAAPLVNQIKDDLEYQRKVELQKVQYNAQERIQKIEEERVRKVEEIASQYEEVVAHHDKKVVESEQQVAKQNANYSATRQRLDELRARVRDRLQDIGGREGYNKLDQIQTTLKTYSAPPAKQEPAKYEPPQTEGAARARPEVKKEEPAVIVAAKDEKGNAVYVPPSIIKATEQTDTSAGLEAIVEQKPKRGFFRKFLRVINPFSDLYWGDKP